MNTAVLSRRISSTAPLSDAKDVLMALHGIMKTTAPIVSKSTTRHARRFHRAVEGVSQGATRYFKRRLGHSFALANNPVTTRTNLQVASRFLMASPGRSMGKNAPQVSVLNMSKIRMHAQIMRRQAQSMLGTMFNRIAANMADMAIGPIDSPRMVYARARYANSSVRNNFVV